MTGRKLREAREAQGHTQEWVAREIGCSLRSIVSWEAGEHDPKGANLRAVEAYIAAAPLAEARNAEAE